MVLTIADAFTSIAAGFSSALGGPYHPSIVRTQEDPVYDDGGSIITPGDVVERDCLCQVDSVTEAMRAEKGYADQDVRLLIIDLKGSLDTDAVVEVTGGPHVGTYSVQTVSADPFSIYRECRGRRV